MTAFLQTMGWADPFREVRRLQGDLDRLFDPWPSSRARDYPPLNLWAGEEGVIVAAELPGVTGDQIQVSVHKNTLTLTGRREPVASGGENEPLRQELPGGAFTRTVSLPFAVDPEQVSARAEGGILIIHLPRPAADRPKRIPIAAA